MTATCCEVTPVLDELDPPGWAEFKRVWEWHPEAGKLDPHHVFGRGFRDWQDRWNVVAALRPAHEFVQSTRVGRLVCCLVLERRGDFDRSRIRAAVGFDPIGAICNDIANGIFSGACLKAAESFCRRHGENCLPEVG